MCVANFEQFFRRLGCRLRELRKQRNLSQENMIIYGFSAKHWQQLEAGRPMTMTTLVRACEVLRVTLADLLVDIDDGIYDSPDAVMAKRMMDNSRQVSENS
jgi:transcriptional regulator with XRE-family HTH domain